MWLIDTSTLTLTFHANTPSKSYIILSHTWGDGEVTFQDLHQHRHHDGGHRQLAKFKKTGFAKIQAVCSLAQARGFAYAWVDTCCIDKTSSAELTENINAMYRYYASSAFCFAYLCDLPPLTEDQKREEVNWWSDYDRYTNGYDHFAAPSTAETLRDCRWFSRGWTLQELIAPRYVEFYDADWDFRGSRDNWKGTLAEITGVNLSVLSHERSLDTVPVATRLSWAARRETSRQEDAAYCLLGLFGVYMPLIYGEGDNAFLRLQEEICRMTNDLSLFAWKASPPAGAEQRQQQQMFRGIFARSASEFAHCNRLHAAQSKGFTGEFSITNKGLRFEQRLTPSFAPVYVYEMDVQSFLDDAYLGIYLAKVDEKFVRFRPGELVEKTRRAKLPGNETAFYVKKVLGRDESEAMQDKLETSTEIMLIHDPEQLDIIGVGPKGAWHAQQRTFFTQIKDTGSRFTCYWHLRVKGQRAGGQWGRKKHKPFQCLVACRFRPGFSQRLGMVTYHIWTEQDEDFWSGLWSGPSDDSWRDYRYSPLLVNTREQSMFSFLPSIDHVEDCIVQDFDKEVDDYPKFMSDTKAATGHARSVHRSVAYHEDNDSKLWVRLKEPKFEAWSETPPRRFTLKLEIEELVGEQMASVENDTISGTEAAVATAEQALVANAAACAPKTVC